MAASTFCLFCRMETIPYKLISRDDNGKETYDHCPTFDKLCQYLSINIDSDWCQRYKDLPQFNGNRDGDREEAADSVELLCLDCFERIDALRKLYQDLEKIKRDIDVSKRCIAEVIISAAKSKEETNGKGRKRGRQKTKSLDDEFVEAFQAQVKKSQDSDFGCPLETKSNLEPKRKRMPSSTRVTKVSLKKSKIENEKNVNDSSSDKTRKPKVNELKRDSNLVSRRNRKTNTTKISLKKSTTKNRENEHSASSSTTRAEDDGLKAINEVPKAIMETSIVKIEVNPEDDLGDDAAIEDELHQLLDDHEDMEVEESTNASRNILKVESTEMEFEIEKTSDHKTRRKSKRISDKKGMASVPPDSKGRASLKRKPRTSSEVGDPASYKFKCRYCVAKFRKAHQYYTHRKSHIPTESKSLEIRSVYGIVNGKKQVIARICSICGHKVNGLRQLIRFTEHMLSHEKVTLDHSATVYSCDQCDKQFNIELNLDLHRRYNHEWHHMRLRCELCGESTKTQADMAIHLKTHDGVTRTHSCKSCPMVSTSLDKLLVHMVKHSRSKQLPCPECPAFVALTIKELYAHCVTVHSELKEKLICTHCEKTFLLPTTLRRHLRFRHGIGEEDEEGEFFCTQCNNGKIYKFKRILDRHVLSYHTDNNFRPYKCDQCEKCFLYNSHLQKHILEKHERIRYPCPHCSKTYSEQTTLGNHLKIHTGEGLLHCDVCGKKFTTQAQLRVHLSVHESKSSVNSFVCETCGMGFINGPRLQKHRSIHQEKKHECPHCQVMFRRREQLRSHLRTHTGERPYVCRICSKGFNRRDILIVHMKCHGMSHEEAKQFCTRQD